MIQIHFIVNNFTYYYCPFCSRILNKNTRTQVYKGGFIRHINGIHKIIHQSVIKKFWLLIFKINIKFYKYVQQHVIDCISNGNEINITKNCNNNKNVELK